MEQHFKGLSNPNGFAFYNGSACPIVLRYEVGFPQLANDMLESGLRMGISLKQQGINYKKQMDLLESTLTRLCDGKGYTQEIVDKFCDYFEKGEAELMSVWYMDVIALEKLKVIKNDNRNGMLYVK